MTEGTVPQSHPALALLAGAAADARKALAMLAADEVWTATNADLIRLLRAQSDLEALAAAVGYAAVREAEVRGLAAADGQTSTAVWLGRLLRLHPGEAKARVKTADTLAQKAPATAAALAEGKLNATQVRAVAAALRRIERHASAAEFAEAEAFLLREGRFLHAGQITRLGRHIEAVLDPDGTPGREERAFAYREFTISDLGNGRHRIRGTLTDEGAAILKAALDPLAAPRPTVDGQRDPRTPGQRNHDALIELAGAYLRWGDLPETRGARPHLVIHATIETMKGDTGHPFARTTTGEDLTIETLRKLACDAGITPVVVDTLGMPLSVGRETRNWPPHIWAALVARDLGCVFPDCTRPPQWCIAHHRRFWVEHHGETSVENGALLCQFHHDQVHHGGWQVVLGEDGHPELIPPPWIDPLQQPRRNAHWKLIRDGLKQDEPDRGP